MQDIHLLQELELAQVEFEQNQVVKAAQAILQSQFGAEQSIFSRLHSGASHPHNDLTWMRKLDPKKRFNAESIESICVKFRLRFLESDLFKGEIPVEAVREIKQIEMTLGAQFSNFKILAPAERFDLKDSTKDPILMAELPNGQFYYIFQWGDDMKWYHHLLKYPFRHIGALAATSASLGLLIAFLVPSQFEAIQAEFFFRFFIFSMGTCLIMTMAIISAILYSKDFSENVWNSKFIK